MSTGAASRVFDCAETRIVLVELEAHWRPTLRDQSAAVGGFHARAARIADPVRARRTRGGACGRAAIRQTAQAIAAAGRLAGAAAVRRRNRRAGEADARVRHDAGDARTGLATAL